MQRAGDARALERLHLGVLATQGHQSGHLVLGEGDLLAAELGQTQVGDLEVEPIGMVGSQAGGECCCHETLLARNHGAARIAAPNGRTRVAPWSEALHRTPAGVHVAPKDTDSAALSLAGLVAKPADLAHTDAHTELPRRRYRGTATGFLAALEVRPANATRTSTSSKPFSRPK